MTYLNTDHLSQRERYLMSMVYSAFLGYTKDQDHAARQVNYIVKSADELEPATTPQPSADAVREVPDGDHGLAEFTEYFVKNYPGPDTIIYAPEWHAPKIFRAARRAMLSAASDHQQNAAQGGESSNG